MSQDACQLSQVQRPQKPCCDRDVSVIGASRGESIECGARDDEQTGPLPEARALREDLENAPDLSGRTRVDLSGAVHAHDGLRGKSRRKEHKEGHGQQGPNYSGWPPD